MGKKITGIISRVHTIKVTYHVDIDLDHLLEVVFVSFLHCKVTLPYPPLRSVLYSLGGSPFAEFIFKEWRVTLFQINSVHIPA